MDVCTKQFRVLSKSRAVYDGLWFRPWLRRFKPGTILPLLVGALGRECRWL